MTITAPTALPPDIVRLFDDDPHPEQSWALMPPEDQQFVAEVTGAHLLDPTRGDGAEDADQRRASRLAAEQWHHFWPYIRTQQLAEAEMQFHANPSPPPAGMRTGLPLPVTLITGPPGTGKSKLLRQLAAGTMCESAWDARRASAEPPDNALFSARRRDVVFFSLLKKVQERQLFAALCEQVGAPWDKDPRTSFERAVERHGVRWIFIDEIQFINFDGQTGKYVHDGLRSLQNLGIRVVLSGHNMREQLADQKTGAREAARVQSEARWEMIELRPFGHANESEAREWRRFLRKIEGRLRLRGHAVGDTVLSEEFEEYLWVSTLGYANHLSTLVSKAANAAARLPEQRITRKVLDGLQIEIRGERSRAQRLNLWDAGRFSFKKSWG